MWLASDTLPFSYDCGISVSSGSFELSFSFQGSQWVQFLSLGEKAVMGEKKLCEEKASAQNPILQSGHTSENM